MGSQSFLTRLDGHLYLCLPAETFEQCSIPMLLDLLPKQTRPYFQNKLCNNRSISRHKEASSYCQLTVQYKQISLSTVESNFEASLIQNILDLMPKAKSFNSNNTVVNHNLSCMMHRTTTDTYFFHFSFLFFSSLHPKNPYPF